MVNAAKYSVIDSLCTIVSLVGFKFVLDVNYEASSCYPV